MPLAEASVWADIASVRIEKHAEVCPTCKEKKYELATHLIEFDIAGKQTYRRVLPTTPAPVDPTDGTVVPTAQQYSIECVFNPISAANVAIRLVRAFSAVKGSVENRKGVMQDRPKDLWQLLLMLYQDVEILLDAEVKCQKVYSPCYVIGDIHGNLEDLLTMERALWNEMPCIGANFLFLGDYVSNYFRLDLAVLN